ncbi:hypothetical protein LV780_04915 [Cereibacter azotoformans]|uniref:DUF6950 family protein n=1 Tax=Cereibacter azotoformans TaxID=43057 RepID=UPI001F26C55E|nr:hypothetical protein [Cereibacter azotoformans]UIJ31522.1 hypothetical protein LV780_04915 [Cereibacter azotoformans]
MTCTMSPLFAHLHLWAGRPFVWGSCDCCTIVADWVLHLRGVDPMADDRLTYGSAGECQRATRFFTDPVGAFARRLEPLGIGRTEGPVTGDVGIALAMIEGQMRPHGTICLGETWAVKSERGITCYRPEIIAAWGMGYRA